MVPETKTDFIKVHKVKIAVALLIVILISAIIGAYFLYQTYNASLAGNSAKPTPTPTAEITSSPTSSPTPTTLNNDKVYYFTSKSKAPNTDFYFAEYDSSTSTKKDLYTYTKVSANYDSQGSNYEVIYLFAVSENGNLYFVTGSDTTKLYAVQNSKLSMLYEAKSGYISNIYLSNDSKSLYITSFRYSVVEPNKNISTLTKVDLSTNKSEVILQNSNVYKIIGENGTKLYLESHPIDILGGSGDIDRTAKLEFDSYDLSTKKLQKIGSYEKGSLSKINFSNNKVVLTYLDKFLLSNTPNDGNKYNMDLIDLTTGKTTKIFAQDESLDIKILGWRDNENLIFVDGKSAGKDSLNLEIIENQLSEIDISTKSVTDLELFGESTKFANNANVLNSNTIYALMPTNDTNTTSELVKFDLTTKEKKTLDQNAYKSGDLYLVDMGD